MPGPPRPERLRAPGHATGARARGREGGGGIEGTSDTRGMAAYERITALPADEVLRAAREFLVGRIPLVETARGGHSLTLTGGDGTVEIEAHAHGLSTAVEARTDQLRTSRIDVETQHFLNELPYEPGDRPGGRA